MHDCVGRCIPLWYQIATQHHGLPGNPGCPSCSDRRKSHRFLHHHQAQMSTQHLPFPRTLTVSSTSTCSWLAGCLLSAQRFRGFTLHTQDRYGRQARSPCCMLRGCGRLLVISRPAASSSAASLASTSECCEIRYLWRTCSGKNFLPNRRERWGKSLQFKALFIFHLQFCCIDSCGWGTR